MKSSFNTGESAGALTGLVTWSQVNDIWYSGSLYSMSTNNNNNNNNNNNDDNNDDNDDDKKKIIMHLISTEGL